MIKQLRLNECDSTQDELKRHVEAYQLVSTQKQTLGRGRGVNKWEHQAGSLAFSFLATPHPQLTWQALEVAVSIAESLENEFSIQVGLKWPNDIYQNEKKCGGILLQHQSPHMYIGVGINLWPNNLWGSVLPTKQELTQGWEHSLPLRFVESYLSQHPRSPEKIRNEWNKRCVHLNKQVTITEGQDVIKGNFDGLGIHGEALIDGKSIFNGTLRWA